jgi:tetratricopeptide (TPR) repeat protein
VARGTQHRKRRPTKAAAASAVTAAKPRKQRPPQWQEQLFFQRLRVHAKWAFVFLALVFAVGFVVFGVGSGSTGISSALENAFNFGGGGGGTSVSSLQAKVTKNPSNAQAWRDLATAFETKHETQQAVSALQSYTTLRPHDQDALLDLAGQYQQLAQQYANDYSNAQTAAVQSQVPSSSSIFAPPSTTPLGKAFASSSGLQDPITNAVQTRVTEQENAALTSYRTAGANAEATYQKLAKLSPRDASTQVLLAQAAQAAGDTNTAIAAYKKFLKLAPNDTSAPSIRAQLKSLERSAAATAAKP